MLMGGSGAFLVGDAFLYEIEHVNFLPLRRLAFLEEC